MAKEIKEFSDLDKDTIQIIVRKMKKREFVPNYFGPQEEIAQMRNRLAGQRRSKIELHNIEDLIDFNSVVIRKLIQFYLALQDPMKKLTKFIATLSPAKTLQYYLYSANLKFSLNQYLALVTSASVLGFLIGIVLSIVFSFLLRLPVLVYPLVGISIGVLAGMATTFILLLLPKNMAVARGQEIGLEMPFALRHMSTELKSGAGLYRTIQLIATADYGTLSEEFARTINEIEEGIPTTEALKNMAMRVQSNSMRNALNHIVRAMKTGGNLSEVMSDIAEDVAVELRMRIGEFSEKLNFFGVIFIFIGIVFPVMIAVLGGIANAPLPTSINIPLTPPVLVVFYFVFMPLLLGFLVFYLHAIQPKV